MLSLFDFDMSSSKRRRVAVILIALCYPKSAEAAAFAAVNVPMRWNGMLCRTENADISQANGGTLCPLPLSPTLSLPTPDLVLPDEKVSVHSHV